MISWQVQLGSGHTTQCNLNAIQSSLPQTIFPACIAAPRSYYPLSPTRLLGNPRSSCSSDLHTSTVPQAISLYKNAHSTIVKPVKNPSLISVSQCLLTVVQFSVHQASPYSHLLLPTSQYNTTASSRQLLLNSSLFQPWPAISWNWSQDWTGVRWLHTLNWLQCC